MRADPPCRKLRVGFYMFTPMIGGAEMYLKDLVWGLDRKKFEVVLFYESWPEFDRFLELDKCPSVCVRRIQVFEQHGHFGARSPIEPKDAAGRFEAVLSGFRRALMANAFTRRVVKPLGGLLLRYALVPPNLLLLYSAFRKEKVDILHVVNGGYPGALSCQLAPIAAKLAGCSRVVMCVCGIPFQRAFPKPLERVFDLAVRRSVDCVVSPAPDPAAAIVSRRDFPQRKVKWILSGVPDPCSQPGLTARSPGPDATRVQDGFDWLTVIANFLPFKGHGYLLEAFQSLQRDFPGSRLLLIGDGPERPAIERAVLEKGLSDLVVFTGFVPNQETLKLIQRSCIVVHPSETDTVPYVILNAMSLGKPIVATRVGGIPEAVAPGETGFLVQPRDVGALREAIAQLLADPDLRNRFGANARLRYEANFTLQAMLLKYERLFEDLCSTTISPGAVA